MLFIPSIRSSVCPSVNLQLVFLLLGQLGKHILYIPSIFTFCPLLDESEHAYFAVRLFSSCSVHPFVCLSVTGVASTSWSWWTKVLNTLFNTFVEFVRPCVWPSVRLSVCHRCFVHFYYKLCKHIVQYLSPFVLVSVRPSVRLSVCHRCCVHFLMNLVSMLLSWSGVSSITQWPALGINSR